MKYCLALTRVVSIIFVLDDYMQHSNKRMSGCGGLARTTRKSRKRGYSWRGGGNIWVSWNVSKQIDEC